MVGVTLENAAQETEERGEGSSTRYVPKYTMRQLLDPDFRLPIQGENGDISELQGIDGLIYDEVN